MVPLSRDFIDTRIYRIHEIPYKEWEIGAGYGYFELNLQKCELKAIDYGFYWGDDSRHLYDVQTLTDKPGRILQVDVSFNDLTAIDYPELEPFSNLRKLDASFNNIVRFPGVECCRLLRELNLSYNSIRSLVDLLPLRYLTKLVLSNNELTSMATIPSFHNLVTLNLENNKITHLEGVEKQRSLRELVVSNNYIGDLSPVTACLRLETLDASNNSISSLQLTREYVRRLPRLKKLVLKGNPIDNHDQYIVALGSPNGFPSPFILDGATVNPRGTFESRFGDYLYEINQLKSIASTVYDQVLRSERTEAETQIATLQDKIAQLKQQAREEEQRILQEKEDCFSFIEGLTLEQAKSYKGGEVIKQIIQSTTFKPWQKTALNSRPSRTRVNPRRAHFPDQQYTAPQQQLLAGSQNASTTQQNGKSNKQTSKVKK